MDTLVINIYLKNKTGIIYQYNSYNELYNDIVTNKLYDKKDIISAFANYRYKKNNIFLYNSESIISRPELYIKYYKENPELYDQSLLTEDIIKTIYLLNI